MTPSERERAEQEKAEAVNLVWNDARTGDRDDLLYTALSAAYDKGAEAARREERKRWKGKLAEAARRINEINRSRGHVLIDCRGNQADVMPTEEIERILNETLT